MLLADNETKVDYLNNEAIAKTIVQLIKDRPDEPLTVGVHGDWGAGKSSILEMIEFGFSADTSALCLKFNGWRFQGFEDAKIALIEGIVTGLVEERPALTKAGDAVKDVFRRIDWLKIAKRAGGFAFTAFSGIPSPDLIQTVVERVGNILADPVQLATAENAEKALNEVQGLLKPKDDDRLSVPEEISAFREAFDGLLEKAGVTQLVVLIDDLDRCLPDIAIETLEAVRLFVFTSRTAFVVAADEAMIEYSVRKHFPDLPDTTGPQSYARKYLEKLIQVPFRIPALGEAETRIYVTLLLVGDELGEDHPAFVDLLTAARERLKQPWLGQALDSAAIREAMGDDASQVGASLALSDQIGPILASGTDGNPRQIKRFLNSLVLRVHIAEARGFGDQVKRPALAKLMLAERFMDQLFDQIAASAASSPDGKCDDLERLERLVRQAKLAADSETEPSKTTVEENDGSDDGAAGTKKESARLTGWLSSQAIREWSEVNPPIGELDLRPYLFVAKDRKDYFGAASVLGKLAAVVDQLFASRYAVRAKKTELEQLAPSEAAKVFEAARGRIVGSDSFGTAPLGIDGLAVLVEAQSTLRESLVDFLESLPKDQVGPWVCSGWDAALKGSAADERFERLLQVWSEEGSTTLKAASSGVLRARRAG